MDLINIDGEVPKRPLEMNEEIPQWRITGSRCMKNVIYNSILDVANVCFTLIVLYFNQSVNVNLIKELDK